MSAELRACYYSPLCDKDGRAYREFLAALLVHEHGVALVDRFRECGRGRIGQDSDGNVDFVDGVVAELGSCVVQRGERCLLVGAGGSDVGVHGVAGGSVGDAKECGEGTPVGVPGVRDGGNDDVLAGGSILSECREAAGASGGRLPVEEKTRGKWYFHNKGRRERQAVRRKLDSSWRKAGSVDKLAYVEPSLRVTLEKKWKVQNELETLELQGKVEALKLHPGAAALSQDSEMEVLEKRRLAQEERVLRSEKVKSGLLRCQKQRARLERELADGTVEREAAVRKELLEGQIAGKYSLTAPRHVIGYCETLGTGSSSSTGNGKKTVWSGSGASGRSRGSVGTTVKTKAEEALELEVKFLQREIKALKEEAGAKKKRSSSRGFQGNY